MIANMIHPNCFMVTLGGTLTTRTRYVIAVGEAAARWLVEKHQALGLRASYRPATYSEVDSK